MFFQARLTMYAIISELELDLRSILLTHLENEGTSLELFGTTLYDKLLVRQINDEEITSKEDTPRGLIAYSDFGDLPSILSRHKAKLPHNIKTFLTDHYDKLSKTIPIRNRVMHSRPLEYDDLPNIKMAAEQMLESHRDLLPRLDQVVNKLRIDPSFVLDLEIPRAADPSSCSHNLPNPDFDETGFIGRRQQLADLAKHLRGPYPVISIVGEGGLGKTSLAIKAGYELIDSSNRLLKNHCGIETRRISGDNLHRGPGSLREKSPWKAAGEGARNVFQQTANNPFQAVVFASCKSASLTGNDIRQIEGAIKDSLGLITRALSEVGPVSRVDPTDELLSYLTSFKILLVLDNLETVLDERLRAFLERLPVGSKVLLTSRVGLQSLELPVKLKPMVAEEAIQLLRTTCRARGLEDLVKAPNSQLQKICDRLFFNPLAIKWFVNAVHLGTRPEECLRNQKTLLDFCLANVYEHLSEDSRDLLRVFQVFGGALSPAHLATICDMEPARVRTALMHLEACNIVSMQSKPAGSTYITTYRLEGLPRAFLSNHHPVDNGVMKSLQSRRKQLTADLEAVAATDASDPFNVNTLATQTEEERVVALSLREALFACRPEHVDLNRAEKFVARAREMAPEYFEVLRVEAFVRHQKNEIVEAKAAYEAAVDLRPDHAPLRFWYAQFLLRQQDLDGASLQIAEAERLCPNATPVLIEAARVLLYRKLYAECRKRLTPLITDGTLREISRRKAWDLYLQSFVREADNERMHKNPMQCIMCLEALQASYESVPNTLIDPKMRDHVGKAVGTLLWAQTRLKDTDEAKRLSDLAKWFTSIGADCFLDGGTGRVSKLMDTYGFIEVDQPSVSPRLYFPISQLVGQPADIRLGAQVAFKLGYNTQGPIAVQVVPI